MNELGTGSFELANKHLEDAERRDQNICVEVKKFSNREKCR